MIFFQDANCIEEFQDLSDTHDSPFYVCKKSSACGKKLYSPDPKTNYESTNPNIRQFY